MPCSLRGWASSPSGGDPRGGHRPAALLPASGPFCPTEDSAGDDRRSGSRVWIGVLLFPSPGEGLGQARLLAGTSRLAPRAAQGSP